MGRVGATAGGTVSGARKPKPPPKKGPVFLKFVDLSEEALEEIARLDTKAEVREVLKKNMGIDQSDGFRKEILCDLHYHNYSFCVSREFTADKISCFLSIMKRVLEEAVEKKLPVGEAFNVFKAWLLKHSVERPPWSIAVYTFDDVQAITDYVHGTFFRHYKLYMYAYMTRCDINFRVDRRGSAGIVPPKRPEPLLASFEEDPKEQPEFKHLFAKSEQELAAEALRKLQEGADKPEDRAALIKRKVEEGVKDLMEDFEEKLKAQDERFKEMLEGR